MRSCAFRMLALTSGEMKKFVDAPGCIIPAGNKTLLINSKVLVERWNVYAGIKYQA